MISCHFDVKRKEIRSVRDEEWDLRSPCGKSVMTLRLEWLTPPWQWLTLASVNPCLPGTLCFLNATLQQLHALPHFLEEVTYHQVGQQATETIRRSLQDFQKVSTTTTEARGSESEDGARDKSSGWEDSSRFDVDWIIGWKITRKCLPHFVRLNTAVIAVWFQKEKWDHRNTCERKPKHHRNKFSTVCSEGKRSKGIDYVLCSVIVQFFFIFVIERFSILIDISEIVWRKTD